MSPSPTSTGPAHGAGPQPAGEGFEVPPNSLVMGVPGRIVRQTTAEERERIKKTVDAYLRLQDEHRAGRYPAVKG